MIARCSNCNKELLNDLREDAWYRLLHLLSFLQTQGDITAETFDQALNDLMTFHEYALAEREEFMNFLNSKKSADHAATN